MSDTEWIYIPGFSNYRVNAKGEIFSIRRAGSDGRVLKPTINAKGYVPLLELDAALHARGGGLIVRHGKASEEIPRLARRLGAVAVYANRDYEPAAIANAARRQPRLGLSAMCWLAASRANATTARDHATEAATQ